MLVTPDNVDPAIQLAQDQVAEIEKFPFEQPLTEIVATYLGARRTRRRHRMSSSRPELIATCPFSRSDGRRGRGMGEAERQHCCL